jgi:hypothetical protein
VVRKFRAGEGEVVEKREVVGRLGGVGGDRRVRRVRRIRKVEVFKI